MTAHDDAFSKRCASASSGDLEAIGAPPVVAVPRPAGVCCARATAAASAGRPPAGFGADRNGAARGSHQGTSNIALALIGFASLADYEAYRARIAADPDGAENFRFAPGRRFLLSEERTFLRPVQP